MKYTHGKDRRQGSHLTDLIGDGPMFCYVLLIVFTLFFFVPIGLPVPRFSGPNGSAAQPAFCFLLGSQYPISLGPWLQLDDKSLAAATAVPVAAKYWRACTMSPIS